MQRRRRARSDAMFDSVALSPTLDEVTLGKKPARPDTEDEATSRRKMEVQVKEIKDEGYSVDIPGWIPGVT